MTPPKTSRWHQKIGIPGTRVEPISSGKIIVGLVNGMIYNRVHDLLSCNNVHSFTVPFMQQVVFCCLPKMAGSTSALFLHLEEDAKAKLDHGLPGLNLSYPVLVGCLVGPACSTCVAAGV